MASTGTLLTADANYVAKGPNALQTYPLASGYTPYIGQWTYLDSSGNLNPVPVNDGSTDNSALRVIGQVYACGTALLAAAGEATVRYNGVFEVGILSGQTFVSGVLAYLTDDHEITTTSTHNPKAGVFIAKSPAGNALVYQSVAILS